MDRDVNRGVNQTTELGVREVSSLDKSDTKQSFWEGDNKRPGVTPTTCRPASGS